MLLRFVAPLLVIFFLSTLSGFCQNYDYTPIKCQGPIPEIFRSSVSVRFPQPKTGSATTEDRKIKKRILEEQERNEYLLDFLLKRGKVLFGDSLTRYVNAVADKLLLHDEELRSELEFYVLRSSEVNAFATSQGMTFVTVGLLSQLENEAQLAFVLSHEISHHEKDHMYQKIAQRAELPGQFDSKKYEGDESRVKILSDFSKDMEFQADSLGFFRLRRAGYDERAALSMLDILQWSFLPIDNIPFNRDFLKFDSLRFPVKLLSDTIREIPLFDDEKESEKGSHPGISRRRARMSLLLIDVVNKGKYYLVNKEQFTRIRNIAQHELIRLQLADHEFPTALYNSVVLLQREPDNKFVQEAIGKALYGCAKFKNSNNTSSIDLMGDDIYGYLYSCHYFIKELNDEEISFLALRYLYYLEERYASPDIALMKKDAIRDVVRYFDIDEGDYIDKMDAVFDAVRTKYDTTATSLTNDNALDTLANPVSSDLATEPGSDSKYDKLRKEKIEKRDTPSDQSMDNTAEFKFHFLAFGDEARAKLRSDLSTYLDEKAAAKTKKIARKPGTGRYPYKLPNTGKVLVVDPYFFKVEKNDLSVYASQNHQVLYSNALDSALHKTGYETVNLLSQRYSENDTDSYNAMAMVNDWVEEIQHAEDLVKEMVPMGTGQMLELADSSGAQYVVTSVALHKTTNVRFDASEWIIALVLQPILPILILRTIIPKKELFYSYVMYDIARGTGPDEYTGTVRAKSNKSAYYQNHIRYLKWLFRNTK